MRMIEDCGSWRTQGQRFLKELEEEEERRQIDGDLISSRHESEDGEKDKREEREKNEKEKKRKGKDADEEEEQEVNVEGRVLQ